DDDGNITSVSLQDLDESDVTIGRDEANTIRLTDRNVSRKHVRLYADEEGVSLEDLSRYGTRVNGRRISSSAALDVDDILSIGDYEVTLALEGDTLIDEQPLADTLEGVAPGPDISSVADTDSNLNIDQPRLVVLSRTMAGTELRLRSPEAMVGRTPDNDLVLNHRSISRQHARLVWDGSQCSIIDLESANGTRINGELYSRTVLRRGDTVELGHVTLRYVEPGERFDLEPSMIVEMDEETSKQGLLALVAMVVLAAGLGIAWATYYGKPTPKTPPPAKTATVVTPPETRPDPVAEPPKNKPVVEVEQPGTSARDEDELAGLVQAANGHLAAERWDEAIIAYGRVLALDEGNQTARDGQTRAIHEQAAARGYSSVNALVVAGDYRGAWDQVGTLDSIPEQSVYHRRARVLKKAIVASHVASLLDEGYAALRKKKYPQAVSLADAILKIEPENRAALSLSKQAAKADARPSSGSASRANKPNNREEETTAETPEPPKSTPKNPKGSSKLTGKELYKLAREFHNKDPDKAAKLYGQAAAKGHASSWRQLGTLHLQQGDKAKAISAYKKYLDLRPGAKDAEVIKKSVQRLGGTP
ncbi:MAG: FHA domain-containing protein, partial [Myxococcota bacterium]|nr:FHA domain-containing protein [Myxococcota bacterium]